MKISYHDVFKLAIICFNSTIYLIYQESLIKPIEIYTNKSAFTINIWT